MESETQNTGSNKQNTETVTDTENRWLPEGKASNSGDEWNGWRKLVQISSYKVNNRDEMYSRRNIVNNYVISSCGDRR